MIPSESVFVCSLSQMRRPTRNHTCFRSRWTIRKSTLPSLRPTTFSARTSTTPLPFNVHFVEDTFQCTTDSKVVPAQVLATLAS